MAKCPKCATILPDEFGMVTCSSCGSMVFLDMDGNAHVGGDEGGADSAEEPLASDTGLTSPPEFEEDPENLEEEATPLIDSPNDIDEKGEIEEPEEAVELEDYWASSPDSDVGEVDSEPDLAEPEQEPDPQPAVEAAPYELQETVAPEVPQEFEVPQEYEEPVESEEPQEMEEPQDEATDNSLAVQPPFDSHSESLPEDLSDIAEFGNSEASQGREGVIYYDLVIDGIDTKNLRLEVKEALEDIRFNWEIDQVLGAIRGGQLKIEKLSPPKAVLIVKSLRALPLEFQWEQRLLSHSEIAAMQPGEYEQEFEAAPDGEESDENEEDYF